METADSDVEESEAVQQKVESAREIAGESTPSPPSVGAILREARENCGLSIIEVAQKLFLTEHYVHSLETDNYEKLPSEVYVKGYIRSYAQLLGLDGQQVMSAYRHPGAPVIGEAGPSRLPPSGSVRKWTVPLLLLLLTGVVAAAWWAFQTYGGILGFIAPGAAMQSANKENFRQ